MALVKCIRPRHPRCFLGQSSATYRTRRLLAIVASKPARRGLRGSRCKSRRPRRETNRFGGQNKTGNISPRCQATPFCHFRRLLAAPLKLANWLGSGCTCTMAYPEEAAFLCRQVCEPKQSATRCWEGVCRLRGGCGKERQASELGSPTYNSLSFKRFMKKRPSGCW